MTSKPIATLVAKEHKNMHNSWPMGLLVADCPRCGANQITFDVLARVYRFTKHEWQNWFEIFSRCRSCSLPTIFLVGLKEPAVSSVLSKLDGLVSFPDGLNNHVEVERFISVRDNGSVIPPEHIPPEIKKAFTEGATCLTIECFNAAAVMFRLCIDFVTRPLLPKPDDNSKPQPDERERRELGRRLSWLFKNGIVPSELKELSKCIREDGNDGAHFGNLTKDDAEDLLDFTTALLERLITEPKRLELAQQRRDVRRSPKT